MSQPAIHPAALVGRDRELGFLQEFFRQTAVSGGALFLSGDPGVGKTALVNVLAGSTSAAGTMGPARKATLTGVACRNTS